jgi:5-(carboxyamino)imidazole ribonucleotide synthase
VIRPGATIGIIGGGQLGRMLALAAARFGLNVHVFAPEADSPAFAVAAHRTCAAYDDEAALVAFAKAVDVVTYEFENVPRRSAEIVGSFAPLYPDARALATTQDRLSEKTFVSGLGIATAPFGAVSNEHELETALAAIGRPAVLKTRRFGYDGKGQALIRTETDAAEVWRAMHQAPCILEGFVPFEKEISVVAARAVAGDFAAYDVCANTHRDHILDVTRVPAEIADGTQHKALAVAKSVADALGYVGVLAVEMFVVKDAGGERLVVNEIAPRVHNSGHWTIEGAVASQFEQHVRAICGWPLASPRRLGTVEMRNLIGGDAGDWAAVLRDPEAHLHLYGKHEARPGRKMGHVTRVLPDLKVR